MANDRRQSVRRIFMQVAELPEAEREQQLAEACGDEAALRAEVDALLKADAAAGDFMKDPTNAASAPVTPHEMTSISSVTEKAGHTIGRYKLLECIGEGGFGTVWAAEQKEPVRRRVALKIIKLGMDTKQVIARFEAERQALAMMDHPNIARVLDAGATETGRPFFVMELVKGVPILEYCDNEKIDTKARLDLFTKVCHAIQHAHQKGIIHRDIKPSNVLVTLHDGVPVPKVIDFGIAKATNQELTSKTIYTQHRQMIGTPAYMSPEQAEMSGLDIDTRSDVYSLGVLLYELLTGTTPFENESLMEAGFVEMMRIIREDAPHKPSTRLSTLGATATRTAQQRHVDDAGKLGVLLRGDLDWIVMKCLEKDRSRRYETANGLAADIRRHLDDEPVTAGPPSAGYRIRKFVKRNRGQVVGAAAIAAMLVLGVVGTTSGMVLAISEKNRADSEANNALLAAKAERESKQLAESRLEDANRERDRAVEAEEDAGQELARATEIKRLITEMLQSVTPEQAKGADITLLKGILDNASQRLENGQITDEAIAAELHQIVGDVYQALGLYPQAVIHEELSLEFWTRLKGDDHDRTLKAMNSLAALHNSRGHYTEAESLLLRALEIGRRKWGDDDRRTVRMMTNLANAYAYQSRYAEAEPLLQRSLEINTREFGEDHLSTATSMSNLALLYSSNGRQAEAEQLMLRALETTRRLRGAEHPDTLDIVGNLAGQYIQMERFSEAEPLLLDLLDRQERILGEEHPDTLGTMTNLGLLYLQMYRYNDAVRTFEACIPVMHRVLGPEHEWTQNAMSGLAGALGSLGRADEAETMYLETLELRKRGLGEEHSATLNCMYELALLYQQLGRYAEAESLLVKVHETSSRVWGEEHYRTTVYACELASVYRSQGRYDEAESLLLKALEIQKREVGADDDETPRVMGALADLYDSQQRYDEALPLRAELVNLNKRTRGMESQDTLGAMTNLGNAYNQLGRYEDAAATFEECLPVKRQVLGMQHQWTSYAIHGLAVAYHHLGRTNEAEALRREYFAIQVLINQTRAADNPNASATVLNTSAKSLLTHAIEDLRDSPRALVYAQRACTAEEQANGANLWKYLDILALAQHQTGDAIAAVETQKRAIELAPDDEELRATLARYEDAVAERSTDDG